MAHSNPPLASEGFLLTEELLREQAERIAARRGNGGFGRAQAESGQHRLAGPSFFERLTGVVQETMSSFAQRKEFSSNQVHDRLASRINSV
jgi:hypothetical protein